MSSGEKARRPLKVIVLVLACWFVGVTLQSTLGSLIGNSGMVEAGTASLIGQLLAWGLLFLIALMFRTQLDRWLRT